MFTAFFIKWYNDKYKKTVNIGRAIIVLSQAAFSIAFLVLGFSAANEKKSIIEYVELKNRCNQYFFRYPQTLL